MSNVSPEQDLANKAVELLVEYHRLLGQVAVLSDDSLETTTIGICRHTRTDDEHERAARTIIRDLQSVYMSRDDGGLRYYADTSKGWKAVELEAVDEK